MSCLSILQEISMIQLTGLQLFCAILLFYQQISNQRRQWSQFNKIYIKNSNCSPIFYAAFFKLDYIYLRKPLNMKIQVEQYYDAHTISNKFRDQLKPNDCIREQAIRKISFSKIQKDRAIWMYTNRAKLLQASQMHEQALKCYKQAIDWYKKEESNEIGNYYQKIIEENAENLSLIQKFIQCPRIIYFDIFNTTIYQNLPEGIQISESTSGLSLKATRSFKKGDLIYTSCYLTQAEDNIPNEYFLILRDIKENETKYILDKYIHSGKQTYTRQIYGFDSFMNHQCNPTTVTPQIFENLFSVIAIKDIEPGDFITCNYCLFQYQSPQSCIFTCQCGDKNCLNEIKGFKYLDLKNKLALLPCSYKSLLEIFIEEQNYIYLKDFQFHDLITTQTIKQNPEQLTPLTLSYLQKLCKTSFSILAQDNIYSQKFLIKSRNSYYAILQQNQCVRVVGQSFQTRIQKT